MRKCIYITPEDRELLKKLRGHRLSDSELYRKGLSLIPPKELSMEEVLAELKKGPFDTCEVHNGSFFNSCWKHHV
jgi:hypothetical protein